MLIVSRIPYPSILYIIRYAPCAWLRLRYAISNVFQEKKQLYKLCCGLCTFVHNWMVDEYLNVDRKIVNLTSHLCGIKILIALSFLRVRVKLLAFSSGSIPFAAPFDITQKMGELTTYHLTCIFICNHYRRIQFIWDFLSIFHASAFCFLNGLRLASNYEAYEAHRTNE